MNQILFSLTVVGLITCVVAMFLSPPSGNRRIISGGKSSKRSGLRIRSKEVK